MSLADKIKKFQPKNAYMLKAWGVLRPIIRLPIRIKRVAQERILEIVIKKYKKELSAPKPVDIVSHRLEKPWPTKSGAYVRLDYWVDISSGGSYGHTCYVAKELNALNPGLKCAMANSYAMLASMGISQTVFTSKLKCPSNLHIIIQGYLYKKPLYKWLEQVKPAYIYERIFPGYAMAALYAQKVNIPYFVEYNGSELEIRRNYGNADDDLEYANLMEVLENFSLRQATVISVVSEQIKKSLLKRGFDASRICVNPNGVDIEIYCPLNEADKQAIRTELGFAKEHRVLCFTGTFGKWHGVEVLAESIPKILQEDELARFLLIGDGNLYYLIEEMLEKYNLHDKVVRTGRVSQEKGRRFLQAADIYLSPHSGHIKNMPFFGSPTKIFEYMGLGGGIVATDLEQIGKVLSPAIMLKDMLNEEQNIKVDAARAILCEPGNVQHFVRACLLLIKRPDIAKDLGKNACLAAQHEFTWHEHVQRLWRFAAGDKQASWQDSSLESGHGAKITQIEGRDQASIEAQNQWNQTPCGHVEGLESPDLNYFLRVEENRYKAEGFILRLFPFDQFRGKNVLEIGCGHGTDSVQFAKYGANCHVVDITDRHLELTRLNFKLRGYNLEWRKCDATAIDFPDNYFDCIYSFGVLHHIPDIEKVLAEIRRVLKPNGKVCFAVYNKYSAFHIFAKILMDGVLLGKFFTLGYKGLLATIEYGADGILICPYVRLYSKNEFKKLLEKNGFNIKAIGIDCLAPWHFGVFKYLFGSRLQKYEHILGWYVYVIAEKK